MLVFTSQAGDLLHFSLGHFARVDIAQPDTFIMYFEHNLCCLFTAFRKKTLQHFYYKFHWRVIVVEKQHLVKRRWFVPYVLYLLFYMLDKLCCHARTYFDPIREFFKSFVIMG